MTYKIVTKIDIGPATDAGRPGRRVLEIETSKGYQRGTIQTTANVMFCGDVFKTHVFGMGTGGDYSKKMKVAPCTRVTEKAVKDFHEAQRADFPAIEAEARAHYAKPEAPEEEPTVPADALDDFNYVGSRHHY